MVKLTPRQKQQYALDMETLILDYDNNPSSPQFLDVVASAYWIMADRVESDNPDLATSYLTIRKSIIEIAERA